jgi:hypothetical protein
MMVTPVTATLTMTDPTWDWKRTCQVPESASTTLTVADARGLSAPENGAATLAGDMQVVFGSLCTQSIRQSMFAAPALRTMMLARASAPVGDRCAVDDRGETTITALMGCGTISTTKRPSAIVCVVNPA